MRKLFTTAIVCALSGALLGCPPPAGDNSAKTTTETPEGGEATTVPADGDAKPAEGDAEPAKDTKKSNGIDVSHVKPGQKYTYKMDQGVEMTMVYEVKEVTPEAVKYAMTTIMNDAPVGPPNEVEFPLMPAATTEATGEAPAGPEPVGTETITIGGIDFDCKIYETGGVKSWTAMKFPVTIKTMQGDKVTMVLENIE